MKSIRALSAVALMLFSTMALADRVTCESRGGNRANCRMDTSGGVNLVKQLSSTPCRQGSTWGFNRHGVWVDRGCRAVFASEGGPRHGGWHGTSPDVDLNAHGSGRVRFRNNCVVYYRHRRRIDETRECNSQQVRRADEAVEGRGRHSGRGQGPSSGNAGREWDRGCSDAKRGAYDRSRHSQAYEEGWQACKRRR
jgi:hypothetical protein